MSAGTLRETRTVASSAVLYLSELRVLVARCVQRLRSQGSKVVSSRPDKPRGTWFRPPLSPTAGCRQLRV